MEDPRLKKLQDEIRAIKPEEYPVCPGCGERHEPDEESKTAAINVMDVVKGAGNALNSVPTEHAIPMLATFVGSFAENIGEDTWTRLLAHQIEPCSHEGCNCHVVIQEFLPALHKLKVTAVEGRKMHLDPDEEETT